MNWQRDRPFSYFRLEWTATGQRPWWRCLLFAAVQFCMGMQSIYEGERLVFGVFMLLACGANLQRFFSDS